jgi:peroxiredoxin
MSRRVQLNRPAPDFALTDASGQKVQLSDFRKKANLLLVFNRGFT